MAAPGHETSTAALIAGLLDDTQQLLRKEIALAKQEVRDEAKDLKRDAMRIAAGGYLVMLGAALLLVAASLGVAMLLDVPMPMGFAVVGIVAATAGAAIAKGGKEHAAEKVTIPGSAVTMGKEQRI